MHFFFFFFQFFKILIFRVVSGVKVQKNGPKWQKIMSIILYISGTIHHMIVIYGTHVWNDISWHFFHFFKSLIFWVVRRVKGQKTVQNNKKFCPYCSISQEPYIMWLSFMLHMCKMIISPGSFFIILKFWFF